MRQTHIKSKVLSIALAFLIAVTMTPCWAIMTADEASATDYVAQVTDSSGAFIGENEGKYDGLLAAIDAAKEADEATITMLKDVTDIQSSITIPENAKFTIDLNGKTVSGNINGSGVIKLTGNSANLTIKNGTISNLHSKGKYGIYVLTGTDMQLILENVTATEATAAGVYLNKNSCQATLTNCTCTFTSSASQKVTINSGTYSSFGAGSTTKTNILGGTFGTILANAGTISISDGIFNGGFRGQTSTSAPTVNISGGKFAGTFKGSNTNIFDFNLSGGYYANKPSDADLEDGYKVEGPDETAETYKYKVVPGVTYVAQLLDADKNPVGDNEGQYESLQGAFDAAQDGYTVKLLGDVNNAAIAIANKNITFDLNGKKLTGTDDDGVLNLTGTAKLTINGSGLISGSGSYAIKAANTAELTLDHSTIQNTVPKQGSADVGGKAIGLFNSAKLDATTCNIISELTAIHAEDSAEVSLNTGASAAAGNFLETYGAYLKDSAKLTVNGGTLGSTTVGNKSSGYGAFLVGNATIIVNDNSTVKGERYGIADNGEYSPGATITINGGTVDSTATSKNDNFAAIYHPGGGPLTVTGGTIEGNTGVYAKSGTTTISGGTIKAHGIKQDFQHSSSGMFSTGDALVVEACDYPSGIPAVEVTDGAFYSQNANAVASYTQTGYEDKVVTGFLKGGIYGADTEAIDISNKNLIATGYTDIPNPDTETKEYYPWMIGEEKSYVAQITVGDTTTKYETLADAFAAATSPVEIELLQNVTLGKSDIAEFLGKGLYNNIKNNVKFKESDYCIGFEADTYEEKDLTLMGLINTFLFDVGGKFKVVGDEEYLNLGDIYKVPTNTVIDASVLRKVDEPDDPTGEAQRLVFTTNEDSGTVTWNAPIDSKTQIVVKGDLTFGGETVYTSTEYRFDPENDFGNQELNTLIDVSGTLSGTINVAEKAGDPQTISNPAGGVKIKAGTNEATINAVASITTNGTTTYYASLEEADKRAQATDTVVLLKNYILDNPFTLSNDVILDLAGKTLTLDAVTNIEVDKKLTIKDSETAGKLICLNQINVCGTLDVSALGYGTTGLVGNQPGSLAIAATGKVALMSVWDSYSAAWLDANSGAFFTGTQDGAQIIKADGTPRFERINGKWQVPNAVAAIQRYVGPGTEKPYYETYTTLQKAVNDAKDGETVVLLKDLSSGSSSTPDSYIAFAKNKTITIDLNGHKIEGYYSNGAVIVSSADVTIKDSTQSGNSYIENKYTTTPANAVFMQNANNTLTIENITLRALANAVQLQSGATNNTVTVGTGATVKSLAGSGVYNGSKNNTQSNITVNGGTVKSAGSYYGIWVAGNESNVVVNNGTVTGGTYGIISIGTDSSITVDNDSSISGKYAIWTEGAANNIDVKNGTVTGADGMGILMNGSGCTANISGGTVTSTNSSSIQVQGANSTVTVDGGAVTNGVAEKSGIAVATTGCTINVKNGSVTSTGEESTAININGGGNGQVNVTGGTVNGLGTGIYSGLDTESSPNKITVDGGTVTAGDYGIALFDYGQLDVKNGSITATKGHAIANNGSGTKNSIVNISGGTIMAPNGQGYYHAGPGTLNITGGTISGQTGVEMRAGTINVSGGTLIATAEEYECDPNENGPTTSGAALAIAQHTTKKDITANITGGTFKGYKAVNECNPQENDPAPQVNMTVLGGKFWSTAENDNKVFDCVDCKEFVAGGFFSHKPDTKYIAPGKTVRLTTDEEKATYGPEYTHTIGEQCTIMTTSAVQNSSGDIEAKSVAPISGGGVYCSGETANLYAPQLENFDFVGWYTKSNGQYSKKPVSTDMSYSVVNVSASAEYVAVYSAVSGKKVNINATATEGGKIEGNVSEVDPGTTVTITATADEGKKFVYWTNKSGKAISASSTYEVTAVENVEVTAVFSESGSTTVFFKDDSENLLSAALYTEDTAEQVAKVTAPSKMGTEFEGWTATKNITVGEKTYTAGQALTDDDVATIVKATAQKEDTAQRTLTVKANYKQVGQYTIKVYALINGELNETPFATITKNVGTPSVITINKTSDNGVPLEKVYQLNASPTSSTEEPDTGLVSTSGEFTVNPQDGTYYYLAVYNAGEVNTAKIATLTVNPMSASYTNSEKIDLTLAWHLPTGATLVDAGFYCSAIENNVITHADRCKISTSLSSASGSASIHIDVSGHRNTLVYAQAFLKYHYGEKTITVYSGQAGTVSVDVDNTTGDVQTTNRLCGSYLNPNQSQ